MEVRGPQRRGQSGKAEVKGHSGQSPWWGRVLESSERVEQQGLWEERPREAWGPPQNGEAQARLLQMLLFRTLRTLVFQTLHSPQSLHPSALSPLSAPEAQLPAAPSGTFASQAVLAPAQGAQPRPYQWAERERHL